MGHVTDYDLSFSRADGQWWQRRQAEGSRIAIQDAFTGGEISSRPLEQVAGPNISDALAGGQIGIFYTNVAPWHTEGAYCIEQARRVAGPGIFDSRRFLVIDVEIIYYQPTGEWLDEQVVHDAIAWARQLGFIPIVYTAKWAVNWWALRLGHVPQFDAAGWYALYNGLAGIDPAEAPACFLGPLIGKQYGGGDIEGVTVDYNTFDLTFFEPPAEEDDMPDQAYFDEKFAAQGKMLGLILRSKAGHFVRGEDTPAVYLVLISRSFLGKPRVTRHWVMNIETLLTIGDFGAVLVIPEAQLTNIELGAPFPNLKV